ATAVVNATPLESAREPLDLERVPKRALVIDLVYGARPTPWTLAARSQGLEAYDGLGLLVFQARRAITLWLREPVPVDPLARAVGGPGCAGRSPPAWAASPGIASPGRCPGAAGAAALRPRRAASCAATVSGASRRSRRNCACAVSPPAARRPAASATRDSRC